MKYQKVLLILGAAAIALPLLKSLYDWAQSPGAVPENGTSPKVKKIVEQTLGEHKGEESSFVQAFEDALEEVRHDEASSHTAGIRA